MFMGFVGFTAITDSFQPPSSMSAPGAALVASGFNDARARSARTRDRNVAPTSLTSMLGPTMQESSAAARGEDAVKNERMMNSSVEKPKREGIARRMAVSRFAWPGGAIVPPLRAG